MRCASSACCGRTRMPTWEAAMLEDTTKTAAAEWTAPSAPAGGAAKAPADVRPAPIFNTLAAGTAPGAAGSDLDLILDIPVQLTVELGRTKIPIRHILQLAQGSVVELDGLAGEPMD